MCVSNVPFMPILKFSYPPSQWICRTGHEWWRTGGTSSTPQLTLKIYLLILYSMDHGPFRLASLIFMKGNSIFDMNIIEHHPSNWFANTFDFPLKGCIEYHTLERSQKKTKSNLNTSIGKMRVADGNGSPLFPQLYLIFPPKM